LVVAEVVEVEGGSVGLGLERGVGIGEGGVDALVVGVFVTVGTA
jgi:hypothetical protein